MPNQDQGQSKSSVDLESNLDLEKTRATVPGNIPGGRSPNHSTDPSTDLSRPSAGQLEPGKIVGGNYRLKAILGRGGMGVVYLAEHVQIQRDYAMKILAPDQVNEANWNRFQSEGKAIAKLDHHNIVKIYDMGIEHLEHHDCPFYVMDLLQGMSLAEFVSARGPLTGEQCVDIFSQICDGLGYAHQCGIIHRDVKPSNIILIGLDINRSQKQGQLALASGSASSRDSGVVVKIVDFGIAKLVGAMAQIGQSQTATGEVFGSPYYMSPEQCLGSKIDERSDIYSLGCSLFECLTGRPPFQGSSALQTVLMHQNEHPPALADVRPETEFAPAMEELVALMLKKRPAERPQNMAEVMHDLARIKEGKSVKPQAIFAQAPLYTLHESGDLPPEKSSRLIIGSLCLFCLLLIAACGWAGYAYFNGQQTKKTLARFDPAAAPVESADVTNARNIFRSCGPISDGVAPYENGKWRRFRFPPTIALGQFRADNPSTINKPAMGDIAAMPGQIITLKLEPPLGKYTLIDPSILAKIGNEDINRLEITQSVDDFNKPKLGPEFFEAISDWSNLTVVDIRSFEFSQKATLALNKIKPVKILYLRNGDIDGADLAKNPWLKDTVLIDVTRARNVDQVIDTLRGSTALVTLVLDETKPSLQGLEALSSCPALQALSLEGCTVDEKQMEAVAKLPSLISLRLNNAVIKIESLKQLAHLNRLKEIDVRDVGISPAQLVQLKDLMPGCNFKHG